MLILMVIGLYHLIQLIVRIQQGWNILMATLGKNRSTCSMIRPPIINDSTRGSYINIQHNGNCAKKTEMHPFETTTHVSGSNNDDKDCYHGITEAMPCSGICDHDGKDAIDDVHSVISSLYHFSVSDLIHHVLLGGNGGANTQVLASCLQANGVPSWVISMLCNLQSLLGRLQSPQASQSEQRQAHSQPSRLLADDSIMHHASMFTSSEAATPLANHKHSSRQVSMINASLIQSSKCNNWQHSKIADLKDNIMESLKANPNMLHINSNDGEGCSGICSTNHITIHDNEQAVMSSTDGHLDNNKQPVVVVMMAQRWEQWSILSHDIMNHIFEYLDARHMMRMIALSRSFLHLMKQLPWCQLHRLLRICILHNQKNALCSTIAHPSRTSHAWWQTPTHYRFATRSPALAAPPPLPPPPPMRTTPLMNNITRQTTTFGRVPPPPWVKNSATMNSKKDNPSSHVTVLGECDELLSCPLPPMSYMEQYVEYIHQVAKYDVRRSTSRYLNLKQFNKLPKSIQQHYEPYLLFLVRRFRFVIEEALESKISALMQYGMLHVLAFHYVQGHALSDQQMQHLQERAHELNYDAIHGLSGDLGSVTRDALSTDQLPAALPHMIIKLVEKDETAMYMAEIPSRYFSDDIYREVAMMDPMFVRYVPPHITQDRAWVRSYLRKHGIKALGYLPADVLYLIQQEEDNENWFL